MFHCGGSCESNEIRSSSYGCAPIPLSRKRHWKGGLSLKWFFAETGGIGFVSFVYFILWRLNETRVICIGLSISNSFFFNLDKAVVAILSLPLLPPTNKINMTIENNHVLYRGYIFKSLDFFSIVMLVESLQECDEVFLLECGFKSGLWCFAGRSFPIHSRNHGSPGDFAEPLGVFWKKGSVCCVKRVNPLFFSKCLYPSINLFGRGCWGC